MLNAREAATNNDGLRYHLLTGNLMVDLDVLNVERQELAGKGFFDSPRDIVIVDENCSLITPYDILLDRAREYANGPVGQYWGIFP